MILVLAAVTYGAIASWLFNRFVNPAKLRIVINRILAHVMEFALFIDEPGVVLKAQIDLIKANLDLFRQIALPCFLMAVPFVLSYPTMDRHFNPKTSRVLTLPSGQHLPAGVVAETPGVRILRTHEVSWRIHLVQTRPPNFFARHWVSWFVAVSVIAAALAAQLLRSNPT
jgi:hypothetical protein